MLCNQYNTHTQNPAKNRLLVFSQETVNTSPNSFACENSLLVIQALIRGLCHMSHQVLSICGGQHSMLPASSQTYTTSFFPFIRLNVHYMTVFLHTERLKGVWVSKHDEKTETSGYWTEPISLFHCHTDRKVSDREASIPYPKATEPEFALFISYCVLSIDAAIILSHSFHWDSLLRFSI